MNDELQRRYGPTMSMAQLSEVFHQSVKSLRNAISAGRFPVKTFHISGRTRVALTRDVAAYLTHQAQEAA